MTVGVNNGAHDQVREAILAGRYAPRQRLIEADLAAEYGLSRFALRNALIQLAAEGLVDLQPNRGARVREISLAEALEITEMRQHVEGIIAASAARKVTDDERERLLALHEQMVAAVEVGDFLAYSGLNAALHQMVNEIGAHATATRVMQQLHGQLVHHQFRLALVPGRPHVSLPEHLEIIEAVCARDPERASAAMSAHIGSVYRTLSALADEEGAVPAG